MFPFAVIVIIFLIILTYNLRKNSSLEKESYNRFWEKENSANLVRKKDISTLSYIKIPLERFPVGRYADDELSASEAVLTGLSEQSVLNLNGITNTDLKLTYGVQNLTFLSECDENFSLLAKTLVDYGRRLIELGHNEDAQSVLEFGIECQSDIAANYTLLAGVYQTLDRTDLLTALIERAEALDSPRKASILAKLSAQTAADDSAQG